MLTGYKPVKHVQLQETQPHTRITTFLVETAQPTQQYLETAQPILLSQATAPLILQCLATVLPIQHLVLIPATQLTPRLIHATHITNLTHVMRITL